MSVYFLDDIEIILPFTLGIKDPTIVKRALSQKRYSISGETTYWEITAITEPLPQQSEKYNKLLQHIATHRRRATFTFNVPMYNFLPIQPASFSRAVQKAASAGVQAVEVIASQSGVDIPAGSMCRFSNHTKRYLTTNRLRSGKVIQFTPGLIEDVPQNTNIVFSDNMSFPMTVYYRTESPFSMVTDANGLTQFTLMLEEAV